MPTDRITLEGNSRGSDHLMSGLSVSATPLKLLKTKYDQLAPGDRLFIDEDIFCLGDESLAVVAFIDEKNSLKSVQICVVRGPYADSLANKLSLFLQPPTITAKALKEQFF